MGVVYRAWHTRLNRTVALKMVMAGSASPALREQVRRQAEVLARLQHPNIVQLYEVREYQGHPCLVMELVEGDSLDRKLAGNPLPPQEAARLVLTLAQAVQAAHEQGVIHGDLKPASVILTRDGTPKVADFGLAGRPDGGGLVQSGVVLGTPLYMAPEQVRGQTREIGPAVDVYALGVILYQVLTGRPPFQGPLAAVLAQVLSAEPVPPRQLRADVPPELEAVCLRCLRKAKDARYPSAAALAADLLRFLVGEPVSVCGQGPGGERGPIKRLRSLFRRAAGRKDQEDTGDPPPRQDRFWK
jgi:serine/threonine protein kinase